MATLTALSPLDMNAMFDTVDLDGGAGVRTSTSFTLTYTPIGQSVPVTVTGQGTGFTYDQFPAGTNLGWPKTGTLTALSVSGQFSFTGLSVPISQIRETIIFQNPNLPEVIHPAFLELLLAGNDTINGSSGVDWLYGYAGSDTISGGAGNDVIDGGEGIDTLNGGDGMDTIWGGGTAADNLNGGADTDFFFYNSGRASQASNAGNVDGGTGFDVLTIDQPIAKILDSFGKIVWQPGDEVIAALPDDTLRVFFEGSTEWQDVNVKNVEFINFMPVQLPVLFTSEADPVNFNALTDAQLLAINADPSRIYDSLGGHDEVRLPDKDNYVLSPSVTWAPSSTFLAGAGEDIITGGDGDDRIDGGADDDLIFGGKGEDRLAGGADSDTINGGDDIDTINGGDGIDHIFGDKGNDVLSGGKDDDFLVGGSDNDTFRGIDPANTGAQETGVNEIDGGAYEVGKLDVVNYSGARTQYDLHVIAPEAGDAGFTIEVRNKGSDRDQIVNWTELRFSDGVTITEASLAEAGVIAFVLWSLRPGFELIHDFVGKVDDFLKTDAGKEHPNLVKFLKWYAAVEQVVDIASNAGVDVNNGEFRSAFKVVVDRAIEELTNPIINEAVKQMKAVVDQIGIPQVRDELKALIDNGAKDLSSYIDDATNAVLNHAIDTAQNLTAIDWNATWNGWMTNVETGLTDLYKKIPGMTDPAKEFDDPKLNPTVPDAPKVEPPSSVPSIEGTIILGSYDNDFSYPGDGDDIFMGLGGNDTAIAGHGNGNDTYDGGVGFDEIRFASAQAPLTINLALGFADGVDIGHDIVLGFESVVAGAGSDIIIGSAANETITGGAGSDLITGGGGADIFKDTAANLDGDTITDFSPSDKIVITDAALASFSFSLSGNTLAFTGGALTLSSVPTGTIIAAAAVDGGVQLTVQDTPVRPHDVRNDINGNSRSDLLIRESASGWLTSWLGETSGSLSNNGSNLSIQFPLEWKVAGTGDYNGDGRDDLLLRNNDGWLTNWLGTPSGGLSNNGANTSLFFAPEWKVAGNGDFNGDGKADLLLRRDDGWLTNWLGTSTGSFANNGINTSLFFTTDWKIVSTGDFNGDGYTDILLRRDDGWVTNWLGNSSGGFTNNGANTALFFTLDWKVIGTGDINGDGKDDLILRRDDGWITDWLGTANGGFTNNGANTALYLTTDWKISSIADFNGDGREDLLLRNDSGWMTNWLGTATGSFVNNGANFSTFIAPSWMVQDPFM